MPPVQKKQRRSVKTYLGMKSACDERVNGRRTGDISFPETAAKSKAVSPATGSLMTNGVALWVLAMVVF